MSPSFELGDWKMTLRGDGEYSLLRDPSQAHLETGVNDRDWSDGSVCSHTTNTFRLDAGSPYQCAVSMQSVCSQYAVSG